MEDELRKEWRENPDRQSSKCYIIAGITQQEKEEVYRGPVE